MHFAKSELCSESQHEMAITNKIHLILKCTERYGGRVKKDC